MTIVGSCGQGVLFKTRIPEFMISTLLLSGVSATGIYPYLSNSAVSRNGYQTLAQVVMQQ